jgi:hypothetical protein
VHSVALLGVGLVVWLAGSAAADGGPAACYMNILRSCAAMHADERRHCPSGQNTTPCGDLIIQDADVSDIRAALEGETGNFGPVDVPFGTVKVWIDKWHCDGGICNHDGVQQFTCQGRRAKGGACTPSPAP